MQKLKQGGWADFASFSCGVLVQPSVADGSSARRLYHVSICDRHTDRPVSHFIVTQR